MAAPANTSAKPVNVNERTYQEVEYLKKNLGPILVAALAEICIRRPADPIEYLGHWLLRWRYNEELKRRDVQNALDVVRQKQWAQAQEEGKPELFSQGVTPGHPNGPPGYGGPFNPEELGEAAEQEVPETTFNGNEEEGEAEEFEGEAGQLQGHLKGPGESVDGQERRASQAEDRKASVLAEGGERKPSLGPDGQPRKVSGAPPVEGERKISVGGTPAAGEVRKPSVGPEGGAPGEARKTSVGPAAGAPAVPGAEGRKISVGPATAGGEARKTSLGSVAGGPPAAPGAEVRKTSVGPVAGAPVPPGAEVRKPSVGPADARKMSSDAVRKASMPPSGAAAGAEDRKASVGPGGTERKASGGPGERKPSTERKASTGTAK